MQTHVHIHTDTPFGNAMKQEPSHSCAVKETGIHANVYLDACACLNKCEKCTHISGKEAWIFMCMYVHACMIYIKHSFEFLLRAIKAACIHAYMHLFAYLCEYCVCMYIT